MAYDFGKIEPRWQAFWKEKRVFAPEADFNKPKYYVLDMFPYPSGAGLHVGHPLGYTATDIVAKYKQMQGFNVLHPMGYDAFGLPAENYAILTGVHPAIQTEANIERFARQLSMMGLGYAPDSDIRTCDPRYYRWTQWIFSLLFQSWYNLETDRAESITTLIEKIATAGTAAVKAGGVDAEAIDDISAEVWQSLSEAEREKILLNYRLAYTADTIVNWCPSLGTVLANEEVKDGVSERGGYPVERKPMRQWLLRITAYAERLLADLEQLEWNPAVIEMQRNWIGKSQGALIRFEISPFALKPDWRGERIDKVEIEVFTTRPDTIFGVTFLVLAPEHEIIPQLIEHAAHRDEIMTYVEKAKNKNERERQSEVKHISGIFTGAYCIHPFTHEQVPIWIAEYVLAGYGTGAIMAVPAHDSRDYAFAQHFGLPIREVVAGGDITHQAYETKTGELIDSDFLNGLSVAAAIEKAIEAIEARQIGKRKTQYRLRDAIFSRQRYWGEPFPIVWKADIPYLLPENELPVELPAVESYKPTGTGESPLATAAEWVNHPLGRRETNTMPGWAGSSWYFIRYTDPQNDAAMADTAKINYWLPVDLYLGGTEHAVGHLLYARFWTKFLYDRKLVSVTEPFKKLVNQGMIQGRSNIIYRHKEQNIYYSKDMIPENTPVIGLHVDIKLAENDILDIAGFRQWWPEAAAAEFICAADGNFYCAVEIEKMSKSLHNVVNPDDIIAQYGADVFRMYEMFLGPLEQSKPWNTNGVTGVAAFLRKFWALFVSETDQWLLTDEKATTEELRLLHQTIKKVSEAIERLAFNTAIPQLMICTNELTRLGCHKQQILEPLIRTLAPFAPHVCEELWHRLGNNESVFKAGYPIWEEAYLAETEFEYPIQINGKMRTKLLLSLELSEKELEAQVLTSAEVQKYLEGKTVKKVIIVPKKIVNVVI